MGWLFGLKQSYFLLGITVTTIIGHLQPLIKILEFNVTALALSIFIFLMVLLVTIKEEKEERLARPKKVKE